MKTKDAEKRDLKGYAALLREAFVEVADETAEEMGLKKSEFAQKIWPESSPRAASSRWQTMRAVTANTGRPQSVLISDAQRMAGVLGQDLPYLFLRATMRAKKKEAAQGAAEKAVKPRRKAGAPGRLEMGAGPYPLLFPWLAFIPYDIFEGDWMNITIRHEQPEDYRIAEEVTREAFWNLYCPGCNEHYMAHTLRKHADFIPELSFVIELNERIVGSIFYTRSKVILENDATVDTVSFGPVSIHPDFHRKGLGRALISHSIQAAKDSGRRAIIIGGYPYHYEPYGFVGAKKYGISMPDGQYYTGIMALPLFAGALDDMPGQARFSDALYPDMSGFEAFEATFPKKEKLVLPCQEDFVRASTEIDDRVSF